MAIIDKEGNVFDVTSSGGWISGAVILGDTGIGMMHTRRAVLLIDRLLQE